jgi:hypothetical protein
MQLFFQYFRKPIGPDRLFSAKTGGQTAVWPVYRGSVAHPVWCA